MTEQRTTEPRGEGFAFFRWHVGHWSEACTCRQTDDYFCVRLWRNNDRSLRWEGTTEPMSDETFERIREMFSRPAPSSMEGLLAFEHELARVLGIDGAQGLKYPKATP